MSTLLYNLFIVHLVFGLERLIFINEIFSFFGLALAFRYFPILRTAFRGTRLWLSLIFVTGYLLLQLVTLSMRDISSDPYEVARTLPFVYSVFCLFVGCHFHKHLTNTSRSRGTILEQSLGIAASFAGDKLAPPIATIYGLRHIRHYRFLTSVLLVSAALYKTLFVFPDNKVTATLIACSFILYSLSRKNFLKLVSTCASPTAVALASCCSLLALLAMATWHNYFFYTFSSAGYQYFGDLLDYNTIWRAMFWSYSVSNTIHDNLLFGVGFGTALFDPIDPRAAFIISSKPDDPFLPYTLSTHNLFVYLFTRLGLVGFCLFAWFFSEFVRSAVQVQLKTTEGDHLLLGFLTIFLGSLFNVVLESPLYSGIFWISFGILLSHISASKHTTSRATA